MPAPMAVPPVRRTLYVERLEVVATQEEIERAVRSGLAREELAHEKALVEAGKLVLGGPFADPLEGGLFVLRAATIAEARALAGSRPSVKRGLVRAVVTEWQVLYEAPP